MSTAARLIWPSVSSQVARGRVLACLLASVASLSVPCETRSQTLSDTAAMPYGIDIQSDHAQAVLTAAETMARSKGLQVAIAIVEPSGDLVLFKKLSGAPYASTDVSIAKARAAALFKRTTKSMSNSFVTNEMRALSIPAVIPIEGGVPIVLEGKVIGAVGVSGGTAEEDGEIAEQSALAGAG